MPAIDFAARGPWLEDFLDRLEADGGLVIVADLDGRPAGFMTLDGTRSMIDQLAVDPARQGRGVASELLSGAKTLCPGGLVLVVNRDNAPARRLYRRHGFVDRADGINPSSGLATVTMQWG